MWKTSFMVSCKEGFVIGQFNLKSKQLTNVMQKSFAPHFINMAYDGHENVQGLM
jgi:hypothetical protein